jgi:hypothetical protein
MNLYLVKMRSRKGNESFYKVGVTKHDDIQERFMFDAVNTAESDLPFGDKVRKLLAGEKRISNHPYIVEVIHLVSYRFEGDALIAESEILEALKDFQYHPLEPFSGQFECLQGKDIVDAIIEHMNIDCETKNTKAPSELMYRTFAAFNKETDPVKKHEQVLEECRKQNGTNDD